MHMLGMEFVYRVKKLLPLAFHVTEVHLPWEWEDPSTGITPDLIATLADGSALLVEVRNYSLGTSLRVNELVDRLSLLVKEFQARHPLGGKPKPLVVISGVLSPLQYRKLTDAGIDLIDGPALSILERRAAGGSRLGHEDVITSVVTADDEKRLPERLFRALKSIVHGRNGWTEYQRLCGDVFQLAFCPPLEPPLHELSTRSGVNRRDFIFPNYASSGFWEFVRVKYGADHLVVDAKNNAIPLKKDAVLQLANYLNDWGCGRLGILSTRTGASRSAVETIREQWIMHRKMILVLDDGDVAQILELKRTEGNPDDLIRQKIEDFRLSF